ncbi:MAG: hypothetical protein CL916_15200 [Deltaproteobacteria bacterium]|nr:hypothetical protein [Deltaproteobacteria bacterium]
MSLITGIQLLVLISLGCTSSAYAESPQTKVLIPPSTKSDSNKEKQSLEEQKAALFEKAFGKKTPETYYPHDMQIILDQTIVTPMVVDINPYTQSLRFKTTSIKYFLEQHLLKTELRKILGEKLPPTLSEEFLREYGFDIKINMKYQTVSITSPLKLRKQVNLYLRSLPKVYSAQPNKNQPINGYLNTLHAFSMNKSRYSYNGNYNSNIHMHDWLLQTETQYNYNNEQNSMVTSGRIVRDLLEERVRLTFGDNNSPNSDLFLERLPLASGFQQALFGVDVSHVGRMARQSNRKSEFSYSLTVVTRSRIEIEINGSPVYNQIVSPGTYILQGFPFQTGRNNLTIRTISAQGTIQEKQMEYFHNPSLLPKGATEYQFVTGLPYKNFTDFTELDDTRLTNLAYFRYGLNAQFGLTGYMQTIRDNVIVGSIGEYGFGANIMSLELAHSRNAQDQMGQALRLRAYSSSASIQNKRLTLIPSYYTINIDYTSLHFDRNMFVSDTSPRNSLRSVISPSVIWQFTNCCQVQLSAVFRDNRNRVDSQAFELRSFYRIKGIQIDTTLERTYDIQNDSFTFFTNLTWRPGRKKRNRFNYRYSNNTNEHTLMANLWPENDKFMNYQWNSRFINPENQSHDGLIRYQNLEHTLATRYYRSTNVGYNYDRFEVDYDGSRALIDVNHSRQSTWSTTTSMQIATSVAFVGKHWGISRPINESFAILYPNNEGMKDGTIVFKNGSVLDRFSAAVFPFLGSYQSKELGIHSVDMPIGLDLGPQQFILESRLNTGQAIPIGKPGGVIMASAILHKPNEKPFDLEVGTCTYVDDPTLVVQFFTNRKGKLLVQGLKSGTYSVQLLSNEYADFTIEVPKDAQSPFNLGTITLKREK